MIFRPQGGVDGSAYQATIKHIPEQQQAESLPPDVWESPKQVKPYLGRSDAGSAGLSTIISMP
jgi:hypothetical protein